MRCAVLQPAMHWTPASNLRETLQALELASRAGAALLVGPELGLSGFHRRIVESLAPGALQEELARVQETCAALRLPAAVGSPWCTPEGRVFNTHLYIDERGSLAGRTDKRGLTPSEATAFAPGSTRRWSRLGGALVSSVLCRETLDAEVLLPEWMAAFSGPEADLDADAMRLLLWPSYIARSDAEQASLVKAYRQGASLLAASLGAWVLQSNWPQSLNQPQARGFGSSCILAPDGRLAAELPADEVGLWVVELSGATAQVTRLDG